MLMNYNSVGHNYWACTLEAVSCNYSAHEQQLLKSTRLESVLRNKRSHHTREKPPPAATRESPHTATKPSAAKNKQINKNFRKEMLI